MGCFMSNLEIRRLDLSDAEAFMDYIHNWSTDTSPFKIDAVKTYAEVNLDNFAEYVEKIRKEEISAEKPDWSTATKYFAFINGQIAGEISCRWQIEKGILLEWGGHIGYGIAPDFRGQHIAEKMVIFALPKYQKRLISQVMISADKGNVASRKTIEANGGILENTVEIDGDEICRYWINLEKSME